MARATHPFSFPPVCCSQTRFLQLKQKHSEVNMSKIDNPEVARVFDGYPEPMRKKMMRPATRPGHGIGDRGRQRAGGNPEVGRTQLPHEGRQHNQNGLEGQGVRPVRDVLQLQHVVGRHIQSGLRRCVHIRGQQSHRVRRNRRVPGRRTETLHLARSDISSRETSTVARRLTETLSDAFTGNISWTRLTSKRR